MYCTACNLEYPDHLNFCRRCGRPLVRAAGEPVAESVCCTRCGARVIRGENFCQHCGARVGAGGQETVIGACFNCGTYWRSGWFFCKRCGLDRDHALQLAATPLKSSAAAGARSTLEVPPAELKSNCPYCAVAAKPFSLFCENCGMRLPNVEGVPASTREAEAVDLPAATLEEEAGLVPLVPASAGNSFPRSHPFGRASQNDDAAYDTNKDKLTTDDVARHEYEGQDGKRETFEFKPPAVGNLAGTRHAGKADARHKLQLVEKTNHDGAEKANQGEEDKADSVVVAPIRQAAGQVVAGLILNPAAAEQAPAAADRSLWPTILLFVAIFLLMMVVAATWRFLQRNKLLPRPALPSPVTVPTVDVSAAPAATDAPPPGMVRVPGGIFYMGRDEGDEYERPAHQVEIRPFFIDRTEVTNAQFQVFIDDTKRRPPAPWRKGKYPGGETDLPVVNVTWEDANAFAQWAGKRLPTEEEWEFAARGADERLYPWGVDWSAELANTAESKAKRIIEVGRYPNGASPFGVLDMAGNVWEWTAGDLLSYADQAQLAPGLKVIRGGAYDVKRDRATATYRGAVSPEKAYPKTGFRCVVDAQ